MQQEPLLRYSLQSERRFQDKSSETQSRPWLRFIVGFLAAASIFTLIVLIILLAIPIVLLVIGSHYHDPRYCPIEPRISRFLIVQGSVGLGLIILTIIMSLITMYFAIQESLISIIFIIIIAIINVLSLVFSIIWLIIGSVWTFSVNNRVTHQYDNINNFYPYNYCHPVLYRFTFIYLIVAYVLMGLSFIYRCFTRFCCSKKGK